MSWDLGDIVAALRGQRLASLAARQRLGMRVKLPSRKALAEIVDGLNAALFPNRLGPRQLASENVDFFVGRTLDVTLRDLLDQVHCELKYVSGPDAADGTLRTQSLSIVRSFANQLATLRAILDTDLIAAFEGDPAARSLDEVLVCYPGINAIIHHRLAHALHTLGAPLIARIIGEIAHSVTGIDIHPGAEIGQSFFIDHGTGVVIGETAVLGDRVRLYHGVTLGAKRFPANEDDSRTIYQARHPVVEDDVVIYAGATILGRITIGRGSVIGGNVWVTRDVPPHSRVTQAQSRSEHFDSGSGI